jgi:hypothetical protein
VKSVCLRAASDRFSYTACSVRTATGDQGYKIGYGRPPLHSQFKPGTSGNRKGRPEGSRNAKFVVEKVVTSSITIRQNGKIRKTTQLEAMVRAATP